MDEVFLDTSAFLKLYVPEKGSGWLMSFITGKQPLISELTLIETATALRGRYLAGNFTRIEASSLYGRIHQDRIRYRLIPLDTERERRKIVSLSFNLSQTLRLRALDGLQLAAANDAKRIAINQIPPLSFTFVTSDAQLLRVAQAQGFLTENPEDYP